jgi:TIR domain-containing protein
VPHQLFLSHDTRDRERAAILARMISRVSLGQIAVWHSSDQSASGGLVPGHVWLDEIRNRLEASKAVVVLLTPTSLSRPWILFESGFGAAQKHCDVIPVCVGVDRLGDVPFPLAMYQSYQLSDYESLKRFTEKLTRKKHYNAVRGD